MSPLCPTVRGMSKGNFRPTRNKTKLARREAYQQAQALGPLRPVEPDAVRSDGSARAGRDQAYATWAGTVFHPAWCQVVADKWDQDPTGLLVILESEAGQRRRCKAWDNPLID
jgi:hypothetical protein